MLSVFSRASSTVPSNAMNIIDESSKEEYPSLVSTILEIQTYSPEFIEAMLWTHSLSNRKENPGFFVDWKVHKERIDYQFDGHF